MHGLVCVFKANQRRELMIYEEGGGERDILPVKPKMS